MSASDEAVMSWREHIQGKIDLYEDGNQFTFEDLFTIDEWEEITTQGGAPLRLARSITGAFKKRIIGYPDAVDPIFKNVQFTGEINSSGRTVRFQRIVNNNHPNLGAK